MSNSEKIIPFPNHPNTVFVKSEKTYVRSKKTEVINEKEPPKRTDVKNPLTKEHRKELRELINDWVTTSNLAKKPLDYGKAYTKLYSDGLQGEVNGIEQIEESEFEHCRKYIKERIRILETIGNQRIIRRKSDWRNDRIKAIHARCKELGVSDEARKAYQLERFGKASLADLTDDELQEMYNYVMMGTPKFTSSRAQVKNIQQARENALRVLVGFLEADYKSKNKSFDPGKLAVPKRKMFELLKQREPDLFRGENGDMSDDEFNKFWSKQQLCKLKSGKPLGSGSQ